jgi:5'-nucleotidase
LALLYTNIYLESVTYDSGNHEGQPDLRFIHYNDVYHVEAGSAEPVGGVPKFKTLCQYYQSDAKFEGLPELMTLFSGDAFNPSLESSVTKGKHMVPALNSLKTSVSCLGNHDLDFGVEQFEYLAKQCNFPWLCANVLDPALGENVPLGNCKRTIILESSNGIKIGFIGIVEREWLDTINTLPPNLKYLSASATAGELAPKLREAGAEMVIVLSHQREPNDNKVAEKLKPGTVDMILGGHDHFYGHSIINDTHVLRSGTDFKQLSYIEARRKKDGSKLWDFSIIRRDVVSSIPDDEEAVKMVHDVTAALKDKLEKPVGYTAAPLDARFTTVRLKESNLGNFVCDLMKFHYHADCTIVASGTIRGDQIYPPGVLKVKDIMNCFPFEDPCVVIQLKGKYVVEALENAVGKYPALEGRFAQVSGIEFTFDSSKPEGSRCSDVYIAGSPVDPEKEYKVVTRDYMVRGKDGFTSLMLEEEGGPAKSVVGDETGLLISMILRQYFMSLKVLGKWKNWSHNMGRHWGKVHNGLHDLHPVREPVKVGEPREDKTASKNASKVKTEDVPSLVGQAMLSGTDAVEADGTPAKHDHDSDSEDDHTDIPPVPSNLSRSERELLIARKVMRKWWRLAGLKGHPNMCSEVGEEFGVHWARGIAPKLEGRIKILNEAT